jgi:cytochrome o ubiquinol oxidase subunit 1
MIWFMGFVFLFTLGGVTGVMLAVPPIDFQVHNSLFLVAHFHTMIVTGVVFGFMAGLNYWWPKVFGYTLHEGLGKLAAWCWIVGFTLAFFPLFLLGFMGATRRLDHYSAASGWQPLFIVAAVGVAIIALGVITQIVQVIVSTAMHKWRRDLTGDPWNGRTLEWATASPTQEYNFAILPEVTSRDEFWEQKQAGHMPKLAKQYHDIRVPKNTPDPLLIAIFAFLAGFGFIWHIWWLVILALVALLFTIFKHTLSDDDGERVIPASEVAKIEAAWLKQREEATR